MILAREKGLKVTRRHIRLEELAEMSEAAACGTACVISPIDKVLDPERGKTYTFGDEPGPVLTELYRALKDIQYGRAEDKHPPLRHICQLLFLLFLHFFCNTTSTKGL